MGPQNFSSTVIISDHMMLVAVILHTLLWYLRDTTMVTLWIVNVKAGNIDRLVQIIPKEIVVAMGCIQKEMYLFKGLSAYGLRGRISRTASIHMIIHYQSNLRMVMSPSFPVSL